MLQVECGMDGRASELNQGRKKQMLPLLRMRSRRAHVLSLSFNETANLVSSCLLNAPPPSLFFFLSDVSKQCIFS